MSNDADIRNIVYVFEVDCTPGRKRFLSYRYQVMLCCSVVGCYNNAAKLAKWKRQVCDIHNCFCDTGNCFCPPPFVLFPFPTVAKDPVARTRWAQLLRRVIQGSNKPWIRNKYSRVCTEHFVNGAPSSENPDPQLNLGYEKKTVKKRKAPTPRSIQPQPVKNRLFSGISHAEPTNSPSTELADITNLNCDAIPESDQNVLIDEMQCASNCPMCSVKEKEIEKLTLEILDLNSKIGEIKSAGYQEENVQLKKELSKLNSEAKIKVKRGFQKFSIHFLVTDKQVNFYTGFQTKKGMLAVFRMLKKKS